MKWVQIDRSVGTNWLGVNRLGYETTGFGSLYGHPKTYEMSLTYVLQVKSELTLSNFSLKIRRFNEKKSYKDTCKIDLIFKQILVFI